MPRSVFSQISGLGGWKVTFYATAHPLQCGWTCEFPNIVHLASKQVLIILNLLMLWKQHVRVKVFTMPDTFDPHHTQVLLVASASVRGVLSIYKFGCSKRKQFYCAAYKSWECCAANCTFSKLNFFTSLDIILDPILFQLLVSSVPCCVFSQIGGLVGWKVTILATAHSLQCGGAGKMLEILGLAFRQALM